MLIRILVAETTTLIDMPFCMLQFYESMWSGFSGCMYKIYDTFSYYDVATMAGILNGDYDVAYLELINLKFFHPSIHYVIEIAFFEVICEFKNILLENSSHIRYTTIIPPLFC